MLPENLPPKFQVNHDICDCQIIQTPFSLYYHTVIYYLYKIHSFSYSELSMKRYFVLPLLLLFLVSSCTSKDQQGTDTGKDMDISNTDQSSPIVDTIYCYITSIRKTDSGFSMTYDPIVFVMGEKAVALIKKEHPEIKTEEEISMMMLNDYYISNNDTTTLTGHFASDIPVVMQTFTHDNNGSLSPNLKITTSIFFKALTGDQNWRMNVPYIITRKTTEITSITEQFIP